MKFLTRGIEMILLIITQANFDNSSYKVHDLHDPDTHPIAKLSYTKEWKFKLKIFVKTRNRAQR